MNWLKKLWFLTGGRPMTWLSFRFHDRVGSGAVHLWQDRLGRKWLAEGSCSFLRVRQPN